MNAIATKTSRPGKVILATFAGRQDRMELLTWYARAAIEQKVIDEWHVWDFTRNDSDAGWLHRNFPQVRLTPSEGIEYFTTNHFVQIGSEPFRMPFSVAASNDVHIGLRRTYGRGSNYEVVLGGWGNTKSVIRALPDAELLTSVDQRAGHELVLSTQNTESLFPERGFVDIVVEGSSDGITVTLDGQKIIEHRRQIEQGEFEVLYRSGFGCNAEWRFNDIPDSRSYLFKCGRENTSPPYMSFYSHYARLSPYYRNDTFLKCDDDIVFIDLDALKQFIAFRREHREYFLLSANVINNGVCAYFQQERNAIPGSLLELELPPQGHCGSLWESSQKAEILHNFFLENSELFRRMGGGVIEWNQRISINFIGFLGEDIVHISDVMQDDEHDLCYQSRERSGKSNAIYLPLVVAHLSFKSQDEKLDCRNIIAKYAGFASLMGVAPLPVENNPGGHFVFWEGWRDIRSQITLLARHGWHRSATELNEIARNKNIIDTPTYETLRHLLAEVKPLELSRHHEVYGIAHDSIVSSPQMTRLERYDEMKAAFRQGVRWIEVETSSQCNRQCGYCPNSKFDRRSNNLFFDSRNYDKLLSDLQEIDYSGEMKLVGNNEFFLHEENFQYLEAARARLPNAQLCLFSNGDYITREHLERSANLGVTDIRISFHVPAKAVYSEANILDRMSKFQRDVGLPFNLIQFEKDRCLYFSAQLRNMRLTAGLSNFFSKGHNWGTLMGGKTLDSVRTAPCSYPIRQFILNCAGDIFACCHAFKQKTAETVSTGLYTGNIADFPTIFHAYAGDALLNWRRGVFNNGAKQAPCAACTGNIECDYRSLADVVAGCLERRSSAIHVENRAKIVMQTPV